MWGGTAARSSAMARGGRCAVSGCVPDRVCVPTVCAHVRAVLCAVPAYQAALDGTHQVSAASISTEAAVEVQTKISGGYQVLSAIWTHLPGMRLPYFGGEHMNILHTMMHRIHHDIKTNHLRELQTVRWPGIPPLTFPEWTLQC